MVVSSGPWVETHGYVHRPLRGGGTLRAHRRLSSARSRGETGSHDRTSFGPPNCSNRGQLSTHSAFVTAVSRRRVHRVTELGAECTRFNREFNVEESSNDLFAILGGRIDLGERLERLKQLIEALQQVAQMGSEECAIAHFGGISAGKILEIVRQLFSSGHRRLADQHRHNWDTTGEGR